MSVINQMLAELDERQGGCDSSSVLSGVVPAKERVAAKCRRPDPKLWLAVSLFLLLGLLVFTMPKASLPHGISAPSPSMAEPVVPGEEILSPVSPMRESQSSKIGVDLKILGSIEAKPWREPTRDEPDTFSSGTSVRDVEIVENDRGVDIKLWFDADTPYKLYLTPTSRQLVLELSNAGVDFDSGKRFPDRWVRGLHVERGEGGRVKLRFDLRSPVSLDQATMRQHELAAALDIALVGNSSGPKSLEKSATPAVEPEKQLPLEGPVRSTTADTATPSASLAQVEDSLIAQRYHQAGGAINSGRFELAESLLEDNLRQDRFHHPSRLLLASMMAKQMRAGETYQLVTAGVDLSKGDPDLISRYARLLVSAGSAPQALAMLRTHAPGVRREPGYHAFIAALAQRLGHHASAVETYSEVLEVEPDNGRWWVGLAISLEALLEPDQAATAYQRALSLAIDDAELENFASDRLNRLLVANRS